MSTLTETLTTEMMDRLEMLMAREQLMEDIDAIIEVIDYGDNKDTLVRILCDAVCNNFPTV